MVVLALVRLQLAKERDKQMKKQPKESKPIRPALTPEARENQMIALAVNAAEEQLINGTASSQVITHYLKLGSTKTRLENEKLQAENDLLKAKIEALNSQKRTEELYAEALKAMRDYSGNGDEEM